MDIYFRVNIYYRAVDASTFYLERRFREQQKCACYLSVLSPTILCASGEKEAFDQWQSLAHAVSRYASLLIYSLFVVIKGQFEL